MTGADTTGTRDADLARRLAEATRRADILRAVIETISGGLTLEVVLARIIESAAGLLGARQGAIGVTIETPHGTGIRPMAALNLPPRETGVELPPVSGLTGRVLRDRRPVRLDRYDELDSLPRPEIADHAALGVPIRWSGRIVGVLGVTAPPPHRFDDQAVATLSLFAQYAAIAIEVANRFDVERRRAGRNAMITRIGRAITGTLNLDAVLASALTALAGSFTYHAIAVMLIDPAEPKILVMRARSGVYTESLAPGYCQSIHQGIAGAAACSRRPLLVNDVRADPRYIPVPGGEKLVAELAIPLVVGERLLGLLNVESEQPFTEEDAADLEIAAGQLAVAVENARLFGETQASLEEARLLNETSRRMSVALDVEAVIRAYLEHVATYGRFRCAVVLHEPMDGSRHDTLVVRGRWSPWEGFIFDHEQLPALLDAVDAELDEGRTVTIHDFRTDPRFPEAFHRIHLARGTLPSLALIPLLVGGRRIGMVVLSTPEPWDWPEPDLRPYQVTAALLAAAIQSRVQQQLLVERGRQIAVLEERGRLARELHDSVTQAVFSATMIAESLSAAFQRDPAEGQRRVERLQAMNRAALLELRTLVAELHPARSGTPSEPQSAGGAVAGIVRLRRDGLVKAMTHHCEELAGDALRVEVHADGYVDQPPESEYALFRIAQEAVHNVLKHAGACRVTITLTAGDTFIRLRIEDDGAGFTVPSAAAARAAGTVEGGHGLAIMRERAEAVGGSVEMRSVPGAGTTVAVTLPRKDRQGA